MTTGERSRNALEAWEDGHRRRLLASTADRAADAALSAGGLFLANATLPLGFGLPGGRAGASIGAGLLGAGLAWLARNRRRPVTPPRASAPRMRLEQPVLAAPSRPPLRRAAA